MKKNYQKPAMRVVKMQHRSQLLVGSKKMVTGAKSNLTQEDAIEYAGSDSGYNGDAY